MAQLSAPATVLPDKGKINEFARQMVKELRLGILNRRVRNGVSEADLQSYIMGVPDQHIYLGFYGFLGGTVPRYSNGAAMDLAKALKSAMLDHLKKPATP